MRLSKKFLSDYIDLTDIDYKDLAEKMVFAGNEYETFEKLCGATGLVIGRVVECVNHPESDHLHICQVDLGDKIEQIVCGAPNVKENINVIVAKNGATLPGGITIKSTKLAGVDSNGMICSLAELGLDSKYLKQEDYDGIHILDNDAIVGEDPLKYLELDDEIIDFELTANRADLLSILGMAYEVGAIYNKKINLPENNFNVTDENIDDIMELSVETDACPIYLGKLVRNVEIKESPSFIKSRLMASGIRPINNVVDISNYVMLEYGQPLHFFDADRLGNKVIVRNATDNEKIVTLDEKERILDSSDIVIANENEPVALAGVMGGLSTEVEETTKNIFIESAIFDSLSIRSTSKKILRSEASNRYEKGVDPNRTVEALKRACHLLEKYASGQVTDGMLMHDKTNKESKKIEITLNKINEVLGYEMNMEEVTNIIIRLGFIYKVNDDLITILVPTRRLDVNIKEDLIEEIGRIYGYDHIEGKLPLLRTKTGKRTPKANLTRSIRKNLSSLGLNQVITYSLTSEEISKQFIDFDEESVSVLDPMSEDKKTLRKSLIPSLISVYEYNRSRNIKDINIFETGSVYYKKNDYIEESKVAGLLSGSLVENTWQGNQISVDFYALKGVIENLLEYLGYHNRYTFGNETLKELHPGISCSIKIDNEIIGYMGKVHPLVSKKDIYVFEISIDKLTTKKVREIKFKEISKYPSVNKDLAFVVDKSVTSEEISKILKRVGGRMLDSIDVFDVYVGENVPEGKKSIAYSLVFKNNDRTLTDEEVTNVFEKMITEVETKLNAELRNK
jgi:phenylalanyl-tRNA synthetase beta chain